MNTKFIGSFGLLALLSATQAFAGGDTSGCSVSPITKTIGSVNVRIQRPPHNQCWNLPTSGVEVGYTWVQTNNSESENNNIGFWISLNGKSVYAKATRYECQPARGIGYGHDTSGRTQYLCSASKVFKFSEHPALQTYAYNGVYNNWDIDVAVSLDDHGRWDSRNGQNYSFYF